MILKRLGIGLFLIILFLPATPQDKAEVYASVEHTIKSVNTFCYRNQTLCHVVRTLRGKVETTMEMVRELLNRRRSRERRARGNDPWRGRRATRPQGSALSYGRSHRNAQGRWNNTLTEHDRSYPWHDPNRL